MPTLNPRETKILMAMLAGLGLLAADRLLIAPLQHAWDQLTGDIAQCQAQLAHGRYLLAEKPRIKKEFDRICDLHPANTTDRKASSMTALLRDIEGIARQNKLSIRDLKPELNQSREGAASVSITAQASWDLFARFLYAIQQSPALLQITKASIHKESDNGSLLVGQFVIFSKT